MNGEDRIQVPTHTMGSGPCREAVREDRYRPEFETACQITDLILKINTARRNEGKLELNLCTVRMFAERMLNA